MRVGGLGRVLGVGGLGGVWWWVGVGGLGGGGGGFLEEIRYIYNI